MITEEEYREGFSDDALAEDDAGFLVWKLLNPETHVVVWREQMRYPKKRQYINFAWQVKAALDGR